MNRGALPIRKKRNSRKSSCRWLAAAVLLTVTSKNILQVSQCILDYFDGLIGYAIEFPDCCIQLSLKLCFFFGIFCLVSRFTDGCYFLVKNVVRIILGNIEFIKDMSRNAGGIHVALNTIQETFSESIQKALLHNPNFINDIRLLLGISDKRFYLDMTYLAHISTTANGERLVAEKREDLIKHSTAWFAGRLSRQGKEEWAKLISEYFVSNDLEQILNAFLSLSEDLVKEIFNNLIAPKEIQQKQAKYRGHGAEQLVAQSFYDAGATIYPESKHLTPMAERDPNVNLSTMEIVSHEAAAAGIHSFDLIIKDADGDIRALVQSLIHTSDERYVGCGSISRT